MGEFPKQNRIHMQDKTPVRKNPMHKAAADTNRLKKSISADSTALSIITGAGANEPNKRTRQSLMDAEAPLWKRMGARQDSLDKKRGKKSEEKGVEPRRY